MTGTFANFLPHLPDTIDAGKMDVGHEEVRVPGFS